MKKIYLLSGALLLTATLFAQNSQAGKGEGVPCTSSPIEHFSNSNSRSVVYDTTGVVNVTDFLPDFASVSGSYMWWTFGSRPSGGGYCFGNNYNGWNIWAQGYSNLNYTPVKIIGIIAGFRKKEHDISSASSTSAVTFYLFPMAANMAYNTDNSGTYNTTTANWPGPSGAPVATVSLLFSAIDTMINLTKGNGFPRSNYIPIPAANQPVFTGNFAIGMDTRGTTTAGAGYLAAGTLAPGDTVGLCTDVNGDASNLDLAYTLQGYGGTTPKWFVADQWNGSAPGFTGDMDVDMALFAVFSNVTGINEFYNGMKLTTYPNPSVEKATVEYTLEKNSNNVRFTLFDERGEKVVDNEYGAQGAGTYKIDVETSSLAAGTYFYQLRANGRNFTKQLIVTK